MAAIEVSNSVPRHVQAANFIREKIYNHEWQADEQIPTEHELADMLGMSRGTIRRAINTLVEEGLLVQMRGKGTFVTNSTISHPTGNCLISFAESLQSQGIDFTTRVVRQDVVKADDFISSKLYVPAGSPVLMLDRVRYVDDEPILYFESVENLTALPGLEEFDFNENNLFATIESNYNKRIGYSNAQYAARVAGEKRGEMLGVSPESPVLHLRQQVFLTDNTPIEWSNVWLKANRYIVNTVLQRV